MSSGTTFGLAQTARYIDEARKLIPRGVTSSKRDREPMPLVFERAEGAHLVDIDGNEFIDYQAGFGPMLIGHRPERVLAAVKDALDAGVLFGGSHQGELELAQHLVAMVPSAEMALLCTSGSEATHLAVRIARAATGRELVVKFEGQYHGWLEPLSMNQPGTPAGHGMAPRTALSPAGQSPPDYVRVCPWNDEAVLSDLLDREGDRVAAIIMEPIPFNGGIFWLDPDYLGFVREQCDRRGIALIFDEVITGFRLGPGGAQARLGVTPDITTLGKAMGSGFPIAAVVGSEQMMSVAARELHHAGTYNGGLPAVAAANATLSFLASEEGARAYERLDLASERLADGLRDVAGSRGAPILVDRVGSVIRLSWGLAETPRRYEEAQQSDARPIAALARELLSRGVYMPPRGILYVSMSHTDEDIARTVEAVDGALAR